MMVFKLENKNIFTNQNFLLVFGHSRSLRTGSSIVGFNNLLTYLVFHLDISHRILIVFSFQSNLNVMAAAHAHLVIESIPEITSLLCIRITCLYYLVLYLSLY